MPIGRGLKDARSRPGHRQESIRTPQDIEAPICLHLESAPSENRAYPFASGPEALHWHRQDARHLQIALPGGHIVGRCATTSLNGHMSDVVRWDGMECRPGSRLPGQQTKRGVSWFYWPSVAGTVLLRAARRNPCATVHARRRVCARSAILLPHSASATRIDVSHCTTLQNHNCTIILLLLTLSRTARNRFRATPYESVTIDSLH